MPSLPLFHRKAGDAKRQRAAAVQNLAEFSCRLAEAGHSFNECALMQIPPVQQIAGVSAGKRAGCCIPSPPEFPKLARMSGWPKCDSRFARVMAT
jgi:dienelactone hydrolase